MIGDDPRSPVATPFRFDGSRGHPLPGVVIATPPVPSHAPFHASSESDLPKLPIAVLCHGFKGFRDWGFLPYLSEQCASAGFAALRFDFSQNGAAETPGEISDLAAFRENTLAAEREDLCSLLDHLRSGHITSAHASLDPTRIVLLAHSRGGAAALACGNEDGVSGVVLLASISRYPSVTAEEEAEWRRAGVSYVQNKRTGQNLPLGLGLLDELLNHGDRVRRDATALRPEAIIIHGDRDESVPVHAAHELHSWIPRSALHILPGADHTFGAKHPFQASTPDLDSVIRIALPAMKRMVELS